MASQETYDYLGLKGRKKGMKIGYHFSRLRLSLSFRRKPESRIKEFFYCWTPAFAGVTENYFKPLKRYLFFIVVSVGLSVKPALSQTSALTINPDISAIISAGGVQDVPNRPVILHAIHGAGHELHAR